MIKKILFIGFTSLLFTGNLEAQAPVNIPYHDLRIADASPVHDVQSASTSARTTSASITDTLRYFNNKFLYRNPDATPYPWLLSPQVGTVNITHWGSVFLNPGTVSVTGLQCMVARHPSSPSPSVNVRMYLCSMTGGSPNFPPMDSLMAAVSATQFITTLSGTFASPKVVSGDFALFFRCIPTVVGDSVKLIRTDARTATNTASPAAQRYGEGLGVIRFNGNFYATTNVYGTTAGSDFEFMLSPIVNFTTSTTQASNNLPALCTYTNYSFNNLSSLYLKHRQYNLNEFYRRWKPFVNTVSTINADSVYTWNFGDGSPNRYTASSVNTISATYTTVGTYTVSLTSKYQKMSRSGFKIEDVAYAVKTTSACGLDTYVKEFTGFENLNIYPNPSVNSKATISGLSGNNTISVYTMLGQLAATTTSSAEIVTVDLLGQPAGNYIIKITNNDRQTTKVTKLVVQN